MSKANAKTFDHAADLEDAASAASSTQSKGMTSAGQTLHDLTADWWRWIANSPAATSPINDTTGAWAGIGNDGDIFFLAGSFVGDVTRDITVEQGTKLLVPVLNQLAFQYVGPGERGAANQVQAQWMKSVSDIFLEIDGAPAKNLQADFVRTSWFGGAIEPGSLFDSFGLTGDLASANSVGYWSVIDGLSAGDHTLHYGGTAGSFSTDVTVNLHVV